MSEDALERVLRFLDFLDEKDIHYQIDQTRPDALIVFFTVVGARIEAEFTVKGMTYRCFEGHEDVDVGLAPLQELIERHSA